MIDIIKKIIKLSYESKEGHIPSSLSILDLLYVYYKNNFPVKNLILSKGHAALGLYVILDHFGLLEEKLEDFCKFGSRLLGHPCHKVNNVVCSTGSLGHGLPFAVGLALSNKCKSINEKIFVILGDGECNEGTIWESILVASNHKLNNLVCIIDYNHSGDRALKLGNLEDKFKSFGCYTIEIDGHDQDSILESLKLEVDQPLVILANTIKGRGVKFMENNPEWHHKIPNYDEYNKIINSI
jgi:transketolase